MRPVPPGVGPLKLHIMCVCVCVCASAGKRLLLQQRLAVWRHNNVMAMADKEIHDQPRGAV